MYEDHSCMHYRSRPTVNILYWEGFNVNCGNSCKPVNHEITKPSAFRFGLTLECTDILEDDDYSAFDSGNISHRFGRSPCEHFEFCECF